MRLALNAAHQPTYQPTPFLWPCRVRWSPCGGLLASASDDRSLRLWRIPPAAAAAAAAADGADFDAATNASSISGSSAEAVGAGEASLQPWRVLWGHTARLWDCAFGGNSNTGLGSDISSIGSSSSFLVTASEDCSCRLWCLASGQLLATMQVGCTQLPARLPACRA